jgi:hypothetical protein
VAEFYDSLLDVPLDEQAPDEDGDDTIVPPGEFYAPVVFPRMAGEVVERIVAPFPGPLTRGSRNKGVRAINKALARAGFRRWQVFSFVWTRWTERAYVRFMRSRGYAVKRNSEGHAVYAPDGHRALARFFDAYDLKYLLLAPKPKPSADERIRAGFVAELMYLYNRRWATPYSQARAYDRRKPPRALDCSASGEWAGEHSEVGAISQMPGYGNTDSQISRLRRLGRQRSGFAGAKPGDPIYYGRGGDPSHVAYYLGRKDGRSICWSFGSFPAKILDANYRSDLIGVFDLTGR